ncbi:6-O-methylguanine DNA methyltransferase [Aspergillus coremiiformis]|uniref:Methylated-DNA--protein-cysteine methyltransferase n=1 Tax=Aspergillus coremiiformis TaxID=138285 RepID=A0A5N6ZH98_9EURO|nr:6-O-methylguanine DNA methyltransferase [Aspergillus coremiiformis]
MTTQEPSSTDTSTPPPQTQHTKQTHRIKSHPTLTPHRRRVYLTLLSIPPGRWTTYSALAKHLHSSARAIGTAMRTNPFAPDVPCHRVLAADGSLGGYMGARPASGSANLERKRRILEREGVGFEWRDGRWRARGECFVGF